MRMPFAESSRGRAGEPARRVSALRVVPSLLCAIAVITGMLVFADLALRQADQARQAQVLMERVLSATARVDVATASSLAGSSITSPETIADGLDAYAGVLASLRHQRRLGIAPHDTNAVERAVGRAHEVGMETLLVSHRDPHAGRRMAATEFRPAVERLDATTRAAARRLDGQARHALLRERLASHGSVAVGLVLLALVAWRMHRLQRDSLLAEHARRHERRGEERLHALVRHSSDVVAVIDDSSTVSWISEAVRNMLGFEPAELLGRPLRAIVHPDDAERSAAFGRRVIARSGDAHKVSLRMRGADGAYRHLEIVADNRVADPLVDGVLLNIRDVSERVDLQDELRHQAFHDSLTGLANRALFEDRLAHALARQRRHGGGLAVLFLDLDDFKTVNDSLGHAIGDELLEAIAGRLRAVLREQDTAARLGGDEFAVLLENVAGEEEALGVAERVRRALEPALTIGGRRLTPSASIGVACAQLGETPDELLRNVDVAMYAAKERGKARVAAFETAMQVRAIERLELSGELGDALANEELTLDYQPIVEMRDQAIVGFEALLRWDHPTRGRLFPDRFVAISESTGLIVPIGAWVLRRACDQLRRWQERHPSAGRLGISVNVSAHQLADDELPGHVRDALAAAGLAPGQLTLEITEGLLVDDSGAMQRRLRELREIGVRLAVDDFGTGYSALSYLQSFPLDVLKVDRSFVSGLDHDPWRARLLNGIIDMAHNLSLEVVTEGIEEPGEARRLRDLRSDYGQGYYWARPLDPAAVEGLLSAAPSSRALPAA